MPDLAIEVIIFCILTRLPAKVVAKLKIVCKEWCALLSTHAFEQAHCSRSSAPSNQRTLLIRDLDFLVYTMDFETGNYGQETVIQFPIQAGIKYVSVLAHMDGLLCCYLSGTNELVLWNPTTSRYKPLSDTNGHGIYEDITDTVGIYKTPSNDYHVLHLTRAANVIEANIYSRNNGTWRNIPFQTNQAYGNTTFYWSPGTLCGDTLYFTVCECWVVGINVLVRFDINTENVTEITFPPVPSLGIFQGILANVQNTLHMVLTTGTQEMSHQIWTLQGDAWVSMFPSPPIPRIPISLWLTITHYITNGRWFVMNGPRTLYEIQTNLNPLPCFYPVSWFRGYIGAVYIETLVSP